MDAKILIRLIVFKSNNHCLTVNVSTITMLITKITKKFLNFCIVSNLIIILSTSHKLLNSFPTLTSTRLKIT